MQAQPIGVGATSVAMGCEAAPTAAVAFLLAVRGACIRPRAPVITTDSLPTQPSISVIQRTC